ncbi:L-histidine N(alpha)-methyltransferase [Ramlibacter sp. MAHUQ-53]|uniref:L-histidine N(alpha)-methyltransferase n=1 Tax=unclassified Ramlibacter TaxID=2617605 RepID=UPI0036387479
MQAPEPAPGHAPAAGWEQGFGRDLRRAFAARPRAISPKYFYDAEGSRLFDRICELPEYYPTRVELGLLRRHAGEMARLAGPGAEVVEFGAGACEKVRLLLDALEAPAGFRPVDICAEALHAACARLRRDYPGLPLAPLVADCSERLLLPPPLAGAHRRVGFFPGSTLGNFAPAAALRFLRRACGLLRGGGLLLGVDLVKEPAVLHAAYNDRDGVTAAFNLNLLARANRELDAGFDLARFAHCAFYNAPLQRVEMHLVSRCRQRLDLGGQAHLIGEGESLHTENSHKFTVEGLRALAARAGFVPGAVWVDPQRLFSLHWLAAPARRGAAGEERQ